MDRPSTAASAVGLKKKAVVVLPFRLYFLFIFRSGATYKSACVTVGSCLLETSGLSASFVSSFTSFQEVLKFYLSKICKKVRPWFYNSIRHNVSHQMLIFQNKSISLCLSTVKVSSVKVNAWAAFC